MFCCAAGTDGCFGMMLAAHPHEREEVRFPLSPLFGSLTSLTEGSVRSLPMRPRFLVGGNRFSQIHRSSLAAIRTDQTRADRQDIHNLHRIVDSAFLRSFLAHHVLSQDFTP